MRIKIGFLCAHGMYSGVIAERLNEELVKRDLNEQLVAYGVGALKITRDKSKEYKFFIYDERYFNPNSYHLSEDAKKFLKGKLIEFPFLGLYDSDNFPKLITELFKRKILKH